MSEEKKNKAVELTDDEISCAAGGADKGTIGIGKTKCNKCHKIFEYKDYGKHLVPTYCDACREKYNL